MKIFKWTAVFFLAYCLLAYLYIFVFADSSIPARLVGSVADPSTFMNEQELIDSRRYASIQNFLYLIRLPFDCLVLLNILVLGVAKKLDTSAKKISKLPSVQGLIFTFYFSLLSFLLIFHFPCYPIFLVKISVY